MEQLDQSLKRAAILADFARRLRGALADDDDAAVEALTQRYLEGRPWLVADFYRKVYLRGRRRALEARIRTYDRLLAGHNPRTVRYLSAGWRHQRDEAAAELRDLEDQALLDPPPWPRVLDGFKGSVGEERKAKSEE